MKVSNETSYVDYLASSCHSDDALDEALDISHHLHELISAIRVADVSMIMTFRVDGITESLTIAVVSFQPSYSQYSCQ
jgi:hypothetical protein